MKKLTKKQLDKLYYTNKKQWIKEIEKNDPTIKHVGAFGGDWIRLRFVNYVKQYPPCFSCKYYWEDQGTGDGCLKVINKYNPFKKNIYNYSRCNNRMRNNEFCEYYKKRLKLNKIL